MDVVIKKLTQEGDVYRMLKEYLKGNEEDLVSFGGLEYDLHVNEEVCTNLTRCHTLKHTFLIDRCRFIIKLSMLFGIGL